MGNPGIELIIDKLESDAVSKLFKYFKSNKCFQVGEVTGVMKQNMEKVMERGDKLDDLVDKSEQLEQGVNINCKLIRLPDISNIK